jgi:hypothetical protein
MGMNRKMGMTNRVERIAEEVRVINGLYLLENPLLIIGFFRTFGEPRKALF